MRILNLITFKKISTVSKDKVGLVSFEGIYSSIKDDRLVFKNKHFFIAHQS